MTLKPIFKKVFYVLVVAHILLNISSLFFHMPGKISIGIRKKDAHGYTIINGIKSGATLIETRSIIIVKAKNVLEYVLLTDVKNENLLTICLSIAIGLYLINFISKVDINNPFDRQSYKRISTIGILYICTIIVGYVGYLYSRNWYINTYSPTLTDPIYFSEGRGVNIFLVFVVVIFYGFATYNQQQQLLIKTRDI